MRSFPGAPFRAPSLATAAVVFLAASGGGCNDAPSGTEPGERLAAEVEVAPADVRVESLGEDLVFEARVTDTEGEDVSRGPLEWRTDAPEVLEERGEGRFRAKATGSARVTASIPPEDGITGPSGTAHVEVEQVPVELQVEPDDYTLRALGQQVELRWTALDGKGNPLENGDDAVDWVVDDDDVVQVDGDGTLVAKSDGRTVVSAELGDVSGSATVSVEATFPVRACIGGSSGEAHCDERAVTVRKDGS